MYERCVEGGGTRHLRGEPLYSAGIGGEDKMNLSSASYIARCVKPCHSRDSCSVLVPDYHGSRNCGHYQSNKNQSPEIVSEYSDAGDTFASARPSNAADEDHDAVSSGPHGNVNTQGHKDVVASRDFIMKRFLPAAQAMTATAKKSSAPTSERRSASLPKYSSAVRTSRPGSFESSSSRSKSRFIHEVKQDVSGFSDEEDEERFSACGFPLHFGRMTLLQFRYSFWTSRSSCRSKAPQITKDSKKVRVPQEEASDNSDDLFWSDEEVFEDAMSQAKAPFRSSMNERESLTPSEMRKGFVAEMVAPPARLHSMDTVHTPDHRGFLGVPKASNLSSGEMERARQVDRLGARLTRMLSKTNYMEPRNVRVHDHENECKAGESTLQGPSATTSSSSSSAEGHKTKWVDAFASLRPPPSPKMPSESWLTNTLPPERLLVVKKLSRKPLGSFIPIKPPVKPTSEQPMCEKESSVRLRQTCSLKEHLHGRQLVNPTMQAV